MLPSIGELVYQETRHTEAGQEMTIEDKHTALRHAQLAIF